MVRRGFFPDVKKACVSVYAVFKTRQSTNLKVLDQKKRMTALAVYHFLQGHRPRQLA
jgi:hypothetical protein